MASVQSNELDFDEEDPLKDLLSSSGENTPVRKTSIQKNPSGELPRQQSNKSKLIADLFGLNDPEEVKTSTKTDLIQPASPAVVNKTENPGDWLGLKAEPDIELNQAFDLKSEKNVPSVPKLHLSTSKRNSKEVDGLSAFESRENSKLENIAQQSTSVATPGDMTAKALSSSRSVQDNKRTNSILSSFLTDFDSRSIASSDVPELKRNVSENELDGGKITYSLSASREPRRSIRRKGGGLVDPLGLFTSSENISTNQADSSPLRTTSKDEEKNHIISAGKSSQPPKPDQVPSWLGGGTSLTSSASAPSNQAASITHEPSMTAEANSSTQSGLDILAGLANLETQAGEAATQQQKSLITALALKRQEDVLLKLQTQQAALLAQHEQQLGALVSRQVQRQQQMIRQQEQIQAHIQALMVQPPVLTPITLPPALWKIENDSNPDMQLVVEASKGQSAENVDTKIELKEKIEKLRKENQDLKTQLDFEKQRYDSQLQDMETHFRKQLAIQEETLSKQENRFTLERQAMENDAMNRLSRLKEEHNEATSHQAQRLAQLHGEWLADLQRLGEFHQQAVEMLRSEQTSSIEHWKSLQLAEIEAVKDASSNARLLNEAVKNLQESTVTVQEMRDEIKKEYQAGCSAKYDMIQKQEAQLAGLREALEKQAASLDTERSCLSVMTRDMESRLLRQQQELDNQRHKFEEREKAWEKEKSGAIELLTHDKIHLERLRLEADREVTELSERKLALATEVARLEATIHIQNANALRNSQNAEQMVAEARSTLEAAQEAGKEVQREREEIMALKSFVNSEQKRLDNLEREIQAREQRIEENIMRAKALKEEGVSALDEARRLERERTEHASDLAQRLLHLKEREDRLAEEKLAITLEWKKLQETRDRRVSCHHCDHIESVKASRLINSSENIVDPVPIIMKLEAEQGLDFITLDHPKYQSSFLESVSQ